jgi:hypothetical protein
MRILTIYGDELYHHGILGQKWGLRRFQNKDGTWTAEGKTRRKYENSDGSFTSKAKTKLYKDVEKYKYKNPKKLAKNELVKDYSKKLIDASWEQEIALDDLGSATMNLQYYYSNKQQELLNTDKGRKTIMDAYSDQDDPIDYYEENIMLPDPASTKLSPWDLNRFMNADELRDDIFSDKDVSRYHTAFDDTYKTFNEKYDEYFQARKECVEEIAKQYSDEELNGLSGGKLDPAVSRTIFKSGLDIAIWNATDESRRYGR